MAHSSADWHLRPLVCLPLTNTAIGIYFLIAMPRDSRASQTSQGYVGHLAALVEIDALTGEARIGSKEA